MSKKRKKGESVTETSPILVDERVKQLRQLFPEVVSEGKVDVEKLRAALGDIADDRPERYSFTWAGKRDARKDGFVSVIRKAMETKLGDDAEEAFKELTKNGIARNVAKEALTIAQEKGRFTVWSVVDALTRLSQKSQYAGDRTEADQRAAQLLILVS